MSSRLKTLKSSDDDRNGQTAAATVPYLPDNIIEKILSFLPIDRAAQANTVSKQWATLWPSFPVIDLDQERFSELGRFRSFLYHSLEAISQTNLDKLRVRANFADDDVLVSEWVDFAIVLCVKELDIVDLDHSKIGKNFVIGDDVLSLKSLTRLNLENVGIFNDAAVIVNLPLLKTMSLHRVIIFNNFDGGILCALVSGCPCMEHLSIRSCVLGDVLKISSNSLKCLDIRHCTSEKVAVTAKNLESFTLYSDFDPCHKTLCLFECDNLKHVDIYALGLKELILHSCLKEMENSFNTPHLEYFEFRGYLKAKVHFVEAPSNLLRAAIQIQGNSWPVEYYSAMRDFLESFDCSEVVNLHLKDAQCLIIPEDCRMEWSPPLPSMKQLLVCFSTIPDLPYDILKCLGRSLVWMAPSAKIDVKVEVNNKDEDDNDDS